MPKVILISQVPLPFPYIASWTSFYNNYLNNFHQIDYIVCENPQYKSDKVNYSIVKPNLVTKLYRKFTKKRYLAYTKALDVILQPNQKYIIQIVDNFLITPHIVQLLEKREIRKDCYIQFFYHGFLPFLEKKSGEPFFSSIDEMIFLTHDSYKVHKNFYDTMTCKVAILPNGIDTQKFFKISEAEKENIKEKQQYKNKTIFLWCAQNRPKKGLHIILEAWKTVFGKNKNIELWVIGSSEKKQQEGIVYYGKVPNYEIPNYMQLVDVYLFPSLFQEGFPLSLTEALNCGCYCIASNLGGISEVLNYGNYGKLIENPHFVDEWILAIEDYLRNKDKGIVFPFESYSLYDWNNNYNLLISKAKVNCNSFFYDN